MSQPRWPYWPQYQSRWNNGCRQYHCRSYQGSPQSPRRHAPIPARRGTSRLRRCRQCRQYPDNGNSGRRAPRPARRTEFVAAGGIEHGAASGGNAVDGTRIQNLNIGIDQSIVSAPDSHRDDPIADAGTHYRANGGVHAGRISAAGQNADTAQFFCIFHHHNYRSFWADGPGRPARAAPAAFDFTRFYWARKAQKRQKRPESRRFEYRKNQMRHIHAVIMLDHAAAQLHTISPGDILGSGVGIADDAVDLLRVQTIKGVVLHGRRRFGRISPMPVGAFKQVADFQHLFAPAILPGQAALADHRAGFAQHHRPQAKPVAAVNARAGGLPATPAPRRRQTHVHRRSSPPGPEAPGTARENPPASSDEAPGGRSEGSRT